MNGLRTTAAAAAWLVACANAYGAPARAGTVHAATGRVSGAIVAEDSATYPADVDGIRANVRVTARTAEGTSVGTFRFRSIVPAAGGSVRVTYAIDGLPLHVTLRIAAERVVASPPSPEPAGFFRTFLLTKLSADVPADAYAVTLDAAHASVAGCDFHFGEIEVPPALPAGTPVPAATASATR